MREIKRQESQLAKAEEDEREAAVARAVAAKQAAAVRAEGASPSPYAQRKLLPPKNLQRQQRQQERERERRRQQQLQRQQQEYQQQQRRQHQRGIKDMYGSSDRAAAAEAQRQRRATAEQERHHSGGSHLAVEEKFARLLHHFMEEKGITLSTLFRLIDQPEANHHKHHPEQDNGDDDDDDYYYDDGWAGGERKRYSAFGHTLESVPDGGGKSGDGLMDEEELIAMVRNMMHVAPAQLSDDDLRAVFAVMDSDMSGTVNAGELGVFVARGKRLAMKGPSQPPPDCYEDNNNSGGNAMAVLRASKESALSSSSSSSLRASARGGDAQVASVLNAIQQQIDALARSGSSGSGVPAGAEEEEEERREHLLRLKEQQRHVRQVAERQQREMEVILQEQAHEQRVLRQSASSSLSGFIGGAGAGSGAGSPARRRGSNSNSRGGVGGKDASASKKIEEKFARLLHHFMEEKGITLSTLFRLIDQPEANHHHQQDQQGNGKRKKPPAAFGRTNKVDDADKANDGLMDCGELIAMVRRKMFIGPDELTNGDLRAIFAVGSGRKGLISLIYLSPRCVCSCTIISYGHGRTDSSFSHRYLGDGLRRLGHRERRRARGVRGEGAAVGGEGRGAGAAGGGGGGRRGEQRLSRRQQRKQP